MATVPTGYIFWDVSANKSYAAGKTFPTLGDGDYLVPATTSADGYYQQYIYHAKDYTIHNVTFNDGWSGLVQSAYYTKAQQPPFNTIAGKPVYSFEYDGCTFSSSPAVSSCTNLKTISWWNCVNLTTIPTLPTNIESLYYAFSGTGITSPPDISSLSNLWCAAWAFYNCTSLTSVPTISGLSALTDTRGMFKGCTNITSPPALPSGLLDMGWMFQNCTLLESAPTIPSSVTSMYSSFRYCTSLTGFITVNAPEAQLNASYCFYDTTNTIVLVGSGATTYLSKRSNNKNVYDGIKAYPASFTSIRCDSSGNESASGLYVLLTIAYTALSYSGAKLVLPTLKKDGSAVSATWHIDTKTGTTLTSSGIQLPSSGKLVSIYYLGDNTTAPKFELTLNTTYSSYSWSSSTIQATTTFKEFIIDIRPDGKTIGIGREASESAEGLLIDMPNISLSSSGNILTPYMAGMIIMSAGLVYPNGWLPCDGRLLNRVEYAELFSAIGTQFGAGDGSTTFAIPDLRGRVPVGTGAGDNLTTRNMADQGGEETHTLVADEVPAHTHGSSGAITGGITGGSHSHHTAFKTLDRTKDNKLQDTRVGPYSTSVADTTQVSTDAQTHTHNLPNHTHTSFGGSGAHENMPPFTAIRFIICTGKLT